MPLIYLPDSDTFLDTASIEKLEPIETPANDLHDEPRLSVTVTLRNAPWFPSTRRDEDPEQIAEAYEGKDAEVLFNWAKVDASKTKREIDTAMVAAATLKKYPDLPSSKKPATLATEAIVTASTTEETIP